MHSIKIKLLTAAVMACVALTVNAEKPDVAAGSNFEHQKALALKADVAAQYRVGEMYEKGIGTAPDAALAYLWYRKAATQGHPQARDKLATLERTNSRDTQEAARTEAVMRALRQQEEAAETARLRERERAAAEARAKREAELRAAKEAEQRAAREAEARAARERAAAEKAAAARTGTQAPAAVVVSTPPRAEPVTEVIVRKAEAPAPAAVTQPAAAETTAGDGAKASTENAKFSANPCKGPTAKFLSTCL
jgi:hypothetical protein